jgi:hypothetical protein
MKAVSNGSAAARSASDTRASATERQRQCNVEGPGRGRKGPFVIFMRMEIELLVIGNNMPFGGILAPKLYIFSLDLFSGPRPGPRTRDPLGGGLETHTPRGRRRRRSRGNPGVL